MSLVLHRKKRSPIPEEGQIAIKISKENYNKVLEVADETGKSLREALDILVTYAYLDIEYESQSEG